MGYSQNDNNKDLPPYNEPPKSSSLGRKIINMTNISDKLIPFLLLFVSFLLVDKTACGYEGSAAETMVMFVGEDVEEVTVASMRPESPATAPAIATVVGRLQIEQFGDQTIGDVLAREPGFYMERRGRGTTPYLRGIPDSILFLYDGVPITTDVTKSLYPFERELSLAGIKQIEIIRGPGSVLWGPDAFAGIVNVVPMRGRDFVGVAGGISSGSDRLIKGYVNAGWRKPNWDAFVSLSRADEEFHVTSYDRVESSALGGSAMALADIDTSTYNEVSANVHIGKWLSLSGRLSDYNRRFVMHDEGTFSWAGEKEAPANFLKATATFVAGPSHYTVNGYYLQIDHRFLDVDVERRQQNSSFHLGTIWDRRFWHKGLLTVGGSYRQNQVTGAVVHDGFLPDFLAPSNTIFVPSIEQADYTNTLTSLFSQWRFKFGAAEWWLGGRLDDHSQYDPNLSYSLGLNYRVSSSWRFKASYGTAWRSPFSSQIFGDAAFEPEGVSSFNAQFLWQVSRGCSLEATFFANRLVDHLAEDPYAGLSEPVDQNIYGLELSGSTALSRDVTLGADLTFLQAEGDDQTYRALLFTFLRPDGSETRIYDTWQENFDVAADLSWNVDLSWQYGREGNLTLAVNGGSSVPFSYAKGSVNGKYRAPLLVTCALLQKNILISNDKVSLKVDNLLDEDYLIPDIYGPTPGRPLSFVLLWEVAWSP